MYDYMKALHIRFTTIPEDIRNLEKEQYRIYKRLLDLLERQEQKSLLQLMDLAAELRDQNCLNSFMSGFRLACGIQRELMEYQPQYCFEDEEERRAVELIQQQQETERNTD